jgi:hypothetical protein
MGPCLPQEITAFRERYVSMVTDLTDQSVSGGDESVNGPGMLADGLVKPCRLGGRPGLPIPGTRTIFRLEQYALLARGVAE